MTSQTRLDYSFAPTISAAITFCYDHPDFAVSHMKTSGAQSAATLPTPAMSFLTPAIADLVNRAHSTRGSLMRDVAYEALLLVPTLVFDP
jgi:hypothetical protein